MKLGFRSGRPYSGRLTFDPETGFHTDAKGRKVVTDDAGKTWRYARRGDLSHNARYGVRIAVVDTTANEHARLAVKVGEDEAHRIMRIEQPHHYETQVGDDHYSLAAPGLTELKRHSDEVAPMVTSHTEAYS